MKKKKSEVSMVLFVGSDQAEAKSHRIKSKHLNRSKHYVISIILTIIGLTSTVVFLSLELSKIEKERIAFNKEIAKLKQQIPSPTDGAKARNYIQNIENKLKKINQYLIKRGIKGFKIDDVGGNNEVSAELPPKDIFELYDERLEDFLVGVAFTPIGYPANYAVNSTYGYRSDPIRRGKIEFHPGIDFKGRKGDAVKSTADGKIIIAGWFQGYGNCVKIQHKNNLETLYGHLSKVSVKVGQKVGAGQIVGHVGSTGHSTGNHLHYEVRKNGKPINPKNYLSIN